VHEATLETAKSENKPNYHASFTPSLQHWFY